ncbi:MAG: MBL fold metallo-hydrolase [Planctomycetes bacterium]|nr:MBL fold metallo-hydrolase [Planctomycetota bacterium]
MTHPTARTMKDILDLPLDDDQAALWFLGQAGYVIRAGDLSVAIDPYLTDSVGRVNPPFARALPVPLAPERLKVDVFIVTHDHLDHLDPDTIAAYAHKATTLFVAPRLAARKLASLGIGADRIRRVDAGETADLDGLAVTGVYAVPTGPDVVDTTGYLLTFANGRTVYHSSDTAASDLLAKAAPKTPEVMLVCINGKYGNLSVEQAVRLTAAVRPRVAVPNHYDLMALNSENPDTFVHFMHQAEPSVRVEVLEIMRPFVWSAGA